MKLRLFGLILISLSFALTVQAQGLKAHWNLNDVTFVFPLPTIQGVDLALKATDQNLLPKEIYTKLPTPVVTNQTSQAAWFKDFRVVGIRVDPEALQVRMVWQITHLNETKDAFTTEDSGIHTFYKLTAAQMKVLVAGLWKLKLEAQSQNPSVNTDGLSLQVHPAFANAKYAADFASQLKKLLLASCSSKNIIQATVMQFGVPANGWWEFSGFKKNVKGTWDAIEIPRIHDTIAKFSNEAEGEDYRGLPIGMKGEIVPAPEGENLTPMLHGWDVKPDVFGRMRAEEIYRPDYEKTFITLRSFQNPKLTTAQTLDCVQCHLTDATRFWLNSTMEGVERLGLASDVAFANPDARLHNLRNDTVSGQSTKVFRALGYFKSYPAINQRVINETATVADYLNRTQK